VEKLGGFQSRFPLYGAETHLCGFGKQLPHKETKKQQNENIYETYTTSARNSSPGDAGGSFFNRIVGGAGLDAWLGVDQRSSRLPTDRRLLCI